MKTLSMEELIKLAKKNQPIEHGTDLNNIDVSGMYYENTSITGQNLSVANETINTLNKEMSSSMGVPSTILGEYARPNYTVIKVRRKPKPLTSSQRVYIKTEIELLDLDPVDIITNEVDDMAKYVDEDLDVLVNEGKITDDVRSSLIGLYLDGEHELMTELKNLIFSINCDVAKNNRMDLDRWDNLVCTKVQARVMDHSDYTAFLKEHNINNKVVLPKNEFYLVSHFLFEGEDDKAEFFRCVSFGPTKDTTKIAHLFKC